MKLFPFYSVKSFTNTYVIGPSSGGGDALLVDPGAMDVDLLSLVEDRNYYIRWILLTHSHDGHCRGITTIKKIYDSRIVAAAPKILGYETTTVSDREEIEVMGRTISCWEVPGHSGDSICYQMGDFLFTGDAIGAGFLGATPNSYARALLVRHSKELLARTPDRVRILPGHGPPSSVGIELATNPAFFRDSQDSLEVP